MATAPASDSCAPLVTGGYDCDFVASPPNNLKCPVCLLPFRDPSLLSCCGQKGCASCIAQVRTAGLPCPLCQQPFDTMLDKHYQRLVLNLRVHCSKKREGCTWEGELRHLQSHSLRDCKHVEEACRYNCGGRYQRRLLKNHEVEECPQRPPEVIALRQIKTLVERVDRHQADQARLLQQMQELQQENAFLQSENEKIAKKLSRLEVQLQQLQLIVQKNSTALLGSLRNSGLTLFIVMN